MNHGTAQILSTATPSEIGEWSRKIIEVYMAWYTFFGGTNVVALGWIFGTKIDVSVMPTLKPISILFCALNILGTMSTMFVGIAVYQQLDINVFKNLVLFAAVANSIALLGFAFVWIKCWKLITSPKLTQGS